MPQAATVGRIVNVWLGAGDQYRGSTKSLDDSQAFNGKVLFVDPDSGNVNLLVHDHQGIGFGLTVGPVRDPADAKQGGAETYASWMPYQKAQADKDTSTPASTPAKL